MVLKDTQEMGLNLLWKIKLEGVFETTKTKQFFAD